jgi:hypothetical protein
MRTVLAAATLLAALATPAASAKDGAQAHLLTPLPTRARPGTFVTVRWTVTVPDANGQRAPFSASGMFATLTGAHHTTTTRTATQTHAPFSVRIRVPDGGIHAIKLGLRGFATGPSGTHPAPICFPIK